MINGFSTKDALIANWFFTVGSTIALMGIRELQVRASGESLESACRIIMHPAGIGTIFCIILALIFGIVFLSTQTLKRNNKVEGEPPEKLSVLDIIHQTGTTNTYLYLIYSLIVLSAILILGIGFLFVSARAHRIGEACVPDRSVQMIDKIAFGLLVNVSLFFPMFYWFKDYVGFSTMEKIEEDTDTGLLKDYTLDEERYEQNFKDSLMGKTLREVEETMDITISKEHREEILEGILNWVVKGD